MEWAKPHLDSFNSFVKTNIQRIVLDNDMIVATKHPHIYLRYRAYFILYFDILLFSSSHICFWSRLQIFKCEGWRTIDRGRMSYSKYMSFKQPNVRLIKFLSVYMTILFVVLNYDFLQCCLIKRVYMLMLSIRVEMLVTQVNTKG